MSRYFKSWMALLWVSLGLVGSGCPNTGVVCRAGTVACGSGCVDLRADRRNCGTCGVACGDGQECADSDGDGRGECTCRPGTTECGGSCAVLEHDARNCGQCGRACPASQVCEARTCKVSCTPGVTLLCGSSCVDPKNDVANCGGCGVVCGTAQSCREGTCTYDLLAACFSSGQVVGLRAGAFELSGERSALGSGPQSLSPMDGKILSVDGMDDRLYQGAIAGDVVVQLARSNRTGRVANHVLVDGPFVYVVNSVSGTLQVLERGGGDGGDVFVDDAGAPGAVELSTVAELNLGANTNPMTATKLGSDLWIPLYGGIQSGPAAAGQKVVRVSVASPRSPVVTDTIDLSGLDLRPFDGGRPVARPAAAVVHRGALYVVLNNLNPDTYAPEGPGLVARIDPATKAVRVIDLGADACLNPQWLASAGDQLAVSCMGKGTYTAGGTLVDNAGVVLVNSNDVAFGAWSPRCPPDAGLPDGGTLCPSIQPSRFAFTQGRIYLGDQNGGRVFVLDVDGGLIERRGSYGYAGPALEVCPPGRFGYANVADVMVMP